MRLILCAVSFLILTACVSPPTAVAPPATFSTPVPGLSLTLPANWEPGCPKEVAVCAGFYPQGRKQEVVVNAFLSSLNYGEWYAGQFVSSLLRQSPPYANVSSRSTESPTEEGTLQTGELGAKVRLRVFALAHEVKATAPQGGEVTFKIFNRLFCPVGGQGCVGVTFITDPRAINPQITDNTRFGEDIRTVIVAINLK